MRRSGTSATSRIHSDALLLRRAPHGEADVVLTFLTEERGLVSANARAARASSKRFSGLEPMHLLAVTLEQREGRDLYNLVEAQIQRPRLTLTAHLDRLEAAGRALRWIRDASPREVPEPEVWEEANHLLDALDDPSLKLTPLVTLAAAGLRLLKAFGWGLDLRRCVSCGKQASERASAAFDATRGGLVCQSCGGARMVLPAGLRLRLAEASEGVEDGLSLEDGQFASDLVEATLAAHGRN